MSQYLRLLVFLSCFGTSFLKYIYIYVTCRFCFLISLPTKIYNVLSKTLMLIFQKYPTDQIVGFVISSCNIKARKLTVQGNAVFKYFKWIIKMLTDLKWNCLSSCTVLIQFGSIGGKVKKKKKDSTILNIEEWTQCMHTLSEYLLLEDKIKINPLTTNIPLSDKTALLWLWTHRIYSYVNNRFLYYFLPLKKVENNFAVT